MPATHTLYGADFSLYSGKARSYLRYKGIEFEEVFPTAKVYRAFIIPRTGVRYIPVLRTPDNVVIQDTTSIIDHLEPQFPDRAVVPPTPVQALVARLLEAYGDEWLLIPAMHYRWKYIDQHNDVLEGFGAIAARGAPRFVRRMIGRKISAPFKGALPMLGIHPGTEAAVEASYEALLADLNAHFAQHDYLLGARASIADFGFMGPLYAHLGRDAYPKALMQRMAPNVYAWVQRMNSATPPAGDWPADDAIPDTLLPILARQFREQAPVMLDAINKLDAWGTGQPVGARVPREIGQHTFALEGVTAQRAVIPYAQWMWQRAVDVYAALEGDDRARADAVLAQVGGDGVLGREIPTRVVRRENRLVLG